MLQVYINLLPKIRWENSVGSTCFFKKEGFIFKKNPSFGVYKTELFFYLGWQMSLSPVEPHHILVWNKNANALEVTKNSPHVFACLILCNASQNSEVTGV